MACGHIWPGSIFTKWYTVAAFGVIFGGVEVYLQLFKEQVTHCVKKEEWQKIRERLTALGFRPTEQTIDSMIFFRKVGFVSWERIKVVVKQNHIHLEVPEDHAEEFDNWLSDTSRC